MKLFFILCLSLITWSHGSTSKRNVHTRQATVQTQPQGPSQPQSQDSSRLDCSKFLTAVNFTEKEKLQRDSKFDEFDWRLSKELNTLERDNIVISPISLKVVLAMLYEGARGMTANEIGDALDLNNTIVKRSISRDRFSAILQSLQQTPEGAHKIKMGTHAFIDKTTELNGEYQCKLKNYYNSDIVKVDFSKPSEAIKVINKWANDATEGHIQDLISEDEAQSNTIMLLLNAVYFKGEWDTQFPDKQTKAGTFYLDDKRDEEVDLMNVEAFFRYRELPDIGAKMVELPYKGNKFSMFVLLPDKKTGLDAIANTLSPERPLSNILGNMTHTLLNLTMPKFEFDYTIKLRPTLEKLGIKTMFSSSAELDDIAHTKNGGLVVSNVLQKAGITVTEVGTVAYAATAADLGNKFGGYDETPIDFKVDRPFLFFIQDITTRTTVFVGKVTNPGKAKVVSTPQDTPVTTKPVETASGENSDNRFGGDPNTCNPPANTEYTYPGKFNFFDGDLLQKVANQEKGNFVISPASIKTLLGLIIEGAEGKTLQELQGLLRLPTNTTQARKLLGSLQTLLKNMKNNQEVTVYSRTNAFISKSLNLNKTYENAISELYNAGKTSIDFRLPENAAQKINSWVQAQTQGQIPTLINPDKINPETMAILVNTIYFDGKWKDEFKAKDVKKECFYSEPRLDCRKVEMMYKNEELNYKYHKDFNSHVVQLPYRDERFSMVLVVPENRDGIRRMSMDLNKLTFPGLLDKTRSTEVHLKLPKFTVEYEAELKQMLTQMGLNTVFSEEAKLPYMIDNKQGQVTDVIHKAKIEVSEKGTKAAAASGGTIVPLMSGDDPVDVTADHPFYYFIYEKESKSVLFSGRISSLEGVPDNNGNTLDKDYTPLSPSGPSSPDDQKRRHPTENTRPSFRPLFSNSRYQPPRRLYSLTNTNINYPLPTVTNKYNNF